MVPIRVMLVDDNEIVRRGLQDALERSNDFTVVGQTGEGWEALELAQRLRPDVVLMDVLMPGKNGIDACQEITTALPDAKVLMLTAFSDRDSMDDALAAGATGYLPKLWGRDRVVYSETISD
jgi:DNA-binding NarL/FixJ family response regulator